MTPPALADISQIESSFGRLRKFLWSEVDEWVRAVGADEEQRSDGPTPSPTN
jgi:hypothetical protein